MYAALLLAAALSDTDCRTCHSDVDLAAGVHEPLGCVSCHDDVTEAPHGAKPKAPECAACHSPQAESLSKSIHGGREGPGCRACHGAAHAVRRPSDPASPAAKARLPDTCGTCHADPAFQSRHKTTLARPVEAYRASVHGRRLLAGMKEAASCSDCHGTHGILPARDAASRVQRTAVPQTCGGCHAAVAAAFEASVHGQAVKHGVTGAPVCTDCHGEHRILAPSEPGSLVNPARVSTVTCARCHADERLA
jgi:doubled CXXCH motif protein